MNTNVHVFHKLLEVAVQRSSAEKILKIHQNTSVLESFFSPMKLDSTTTVFMTNNQKIFRTAFSQKKALGAAFVVLI